MRENIFSVAMCILWMGCDGSETHHHVDAQMQEPRPANPDPAPEDADWEDFFHFCEVGPGQCGVEGELCEEERCLLPCEDSGDCPELTVPVHNCPQPPIADDEFRQFVCEGIETNAADAGEDSMVVVRLECVMQEAGKRCMPAAE